MRNGLCSVSSVLAKRKQISRISKPFRNQRRTTLSNAGIVGCHSQQFTRKAELNQMMVESYQSFHLFVHLTIVYSLQNLLEFCCIFQVSWQSWESSKSIAGMVIGGPAVIHCNFFEKFDFFGNVISWNHTDIRANSQGVRTRDSITVESTAIKQNEITCFSINLHTLVERRLFFVLFRHQIPILFKISHSLIHEIFMMKLIRFGQYDEPSLIVSRISQSHNSLIAPHFVLGGRLIAMEERVNGSLLVVPVAIHEAEAVEGTLEIFGLPQFFKQRLGLFPELPLNFGVRNILNHSSVQYRGVVLAENLRNWILPVDSPLCQLLNYIPKLLNPLRTLFPLHPILDDHKPFLIKMVSPRCFLLDAKPIVLLIVLHNKNMELMTLLGYIW